MEIPAECRMLKELTLKLRTPRNPFEFRGARTALPQNCSPATLSPVWALVNNTSVPCEWHEEAKGIHVARRRDWRGIHWAGVGVSKVRHMQQARTSVHLFATFARFVLNCYGISLYRISRLNCFSVWSLRCSKWRRISLSGQSWGLKTPQRVIGKLNSSPSTHQEEAI